MCDSPHRAMRRRRQTDCRPGTRRCSPVRCSPGRRCSGRAARDGLALQSSRYLLRQGWSGLHSSRPWLSGSPSRHLSLAAPRPVGPPRCRRHRGDSRRRRSRRRRRRGEPRRLTTSVAFAPAAALPRSAPPGPRGELARPEPGVGAVRSPSWLRLCTRQDDATIFSTIFRVKVISAIARRISEATCS